MADTGTPGDSLTRYEMLNYNKKEDESNEENAPESDGVNLQCINSSDFVVGKQTTFNGPVTIINYAEATPEQIDELYKPSKEEIVIREKVITPATVSEMKAFAEKKTGKPQPEEKVSFLKKIFKIQVLKIPVVLWVLLVIVILFGCLAFFLGSNGEGLPSRGLRKGRTIKYNGSEYNFFTRKDWNARPPLSTIEMKTPVPYVVISHTATRFCYLPSACIRLIRDIQGDHMNRAPNPFSDIAYSFMIGGDGNIYEGRGWKTKTATTGFANSKSLNVNLIGSFENLDSPTYPQMEATKALLEFGVNNTYIDANYSLISDNSTYPTLSPGIQVYREIQHWPHFNPNPQEQVNQ